MNGKIKIGCVIAFFDNHNNYGTYLQGYATIKKIKELGYNCEIIRYKKHLTIIEKIKLIFLMLRCGGTHDKMRILKHIINTKLHPRYATNTKERTQAVNKYKKNKLCPYIHEYIGFQDLKKGAFNYDLVLVGSDQLWTPMGLYSKFYNLLFVDDSIPKISYAASFGVSCIPDFQKKQTKEYLDRFSQISVREIKGKEIVDSLSKNTATVVADPTLLLTKEEWEKELQDKKRPTEQPYIFCYFLGRNQECRKASLELKKQTGYKIITIKHMDEYVKKDEKFGDESPYNIDPNDFINYIKYAEYICTDSFHCSIFSILFHKKFMTFYRFNNKSKSSRNSRIDSLFKLLNLPNRLYQGNIDAIFQPINYEYVDEQLTILRAESTNFLDTNLKLYSQKSKK